MKKLILAGTLALGMIALANSNPTQADVAHDTQVTGTIPGYINIDFPANITLTRQNQDNGGERLAASTTLNVQSDYANVTMDAQAQSITGPANQNITLMSGPTWGKLSENYVGHQFHYATPDAWDSTSWIFTSSNSTTAGWTPFAGTYTGHVNFTLTPQ